MSKNFVLVVCLVFGLFTGLVKGQETTEVEKLKQRCEDINTLRVINKLGLDKEQIKTMVSTLEKVQVYEQQAAKEEAAMLTQNRQLFEQAWVDLMRGNVQLTTLAQLDAINQQIELKKQAIEKQILTLLDLRRLLTPQQLALTDIFLEQVPAEAPETAAAKEYLLRFFNTVRYLPEDVYHVMMPPTYTRHIYYTRRIQMAQEFVIEFFGLAIDDPRFSDYQNAVLTQMDKIRMMPELEYERTKEQMIREFLVRFGIIRAEEPIVGKEELISSEKLIQILRNLRTIELLKMKLQYM